MARRMPNGVVYDGPFFEADPTKRLHQNITSMIENLTSASSRMMQAQYVAGHASELAATIAEKRPTTSDKVQVGVVYSTLSEQDRARSYVTWVERGRRRLPGSGATVQSPTFKGWKMWAKVTRAIKAEAKEERMRILLEKGLA